MANALPLIRRLRSDLGQDEVGESIEVIFALCGGCGPGVAEDAVGDEGGHAFLEDDLLLDEGPHSIYHTGISGHLS